MRELNLIEVIVRIIYLPFSEGGDFKLEDLTQ
jgi:hypothetical protein